MPDVDEVVVSYRIQTPSDTFASHTSRCQHHLIVLLQLDSVTGRAQLQGISDEHKLSSKRDDVKKKSKETYVRAVLR